MHKSPTSYDIITECKKLKKFSLYEEDEFEDFILSEIPEFGSFQATQTNLEEGDVYYELSFDVYKIGELFLLRILEAEDVYFFSFKDMEDYLLVYSGYDFSEVEFIKNT